MSRRKPGPRPWPYTEIPRPPLAAGPGLISVPEAVGILGAMLYRKEWPVPPESWREKWEPLKIGHPLTRTEYDPWIIRDSEGKEIGRVDGGPEAPELPPGQGATGGRREIHLPKETARAREMLFGSEGLPAESSLVGILHALLSLGLVRAVASWVDSSEETLGFSERRWCELAPRIWARPGSRFERHLRDGFLWSSQDILYDPYWGRPPDDPDDPPQKVLVSVYLSTADVEAITTEQAHEAVDDAEDRKLPHRRVWMKYAEAEARNGRKVNAAGLVGQLENVRVDEAEDGESWIYRADDPLMKWASAEQTASRYNAKFSSLRDQAGKSASKPGK